MKRFYKAVDIAAEAGGFAVQLDGRAMRTPGKELLCLPTKALAEVVAQEWANAGEVIIPDHMVFTRLSNTAIDRGGPLQGAIAAELTGFADTDLICYRASHPERLAVMQAKHWDPLLAWMKSDYAITLTATTGLIGHNQPPGALKAIGQKLAELTAFEITAMHGLTTTTGSVSIAFAHGFGPLSADDAWAAATVDDTFQMSEWGEDAEAVDALSQKRKDFLAASRFWAIVRNDI